MNLNQVNNEIESKIYSLRGVQVMFDRDLAELYGVETRVLNQAVKRNVVRFPASFMFQLTPQELENWKSQFVTSNKEIMGLRKLPSVFTEQGVSMLSGVLKSDTAIQTSIDIINTFVKMRKFLSLNAELFQRIEQVEKRQISNEMKTDKRFEKIFNALEDKSLKPKQGIFFDGQVYDAYVFASDLIKSAKTSLVLIDNYVDESVLTLLSKSDTDCKVTIYTKTLSKQLQLDLKKHNEQYSPIEIKIFKEAHDRFLIIDDKSVYHIGASLKDLGKKWFAFSKFDKEALRLLDKLEEVDL
ncbi:MAG: ORF6N domain-containing protein [Campylobacterota bacterium]